MRKGKTIRMQEDLTVLIYKLTDIYRTHFVNKVNKTNILEKIVVKGFPYYIDDIKIRGQLNPEMDTIMQILQLENDLKSYIDNVSNGEDRKTKIVNFVTEDKLHQAIEDLAQMETLLLKQQIGYSNLVNGMIINGIDYYMDFLETMLPANEIQGIKEIRSYVHSLNISLDSIIKDKEDFDKEQAITSLSKGKSGTKKEHSNVHKISPVNKDR